MNTYVNRWTAIHTVAVLVAVVFPPQPARAITNGVLDGEDHPNVGQFVFPEGLDDNGDGIPDDRDRDGVPDVPASGGNLTLIHPRVAIGAAHVFELILQDIVNGMYTMDELRISFSSQPRIHPETWLEVSHVIIHPEYDPRLLPGWGALPRIDAALVVLKEPAVGVTPAPLAAEGFLDLLYATGALRSGNVGALFPVVGYGDYGLAPNRLQRRNGIRRVAQSEFMLIVELWLFLDQNAAHGNGGSASGDSGGPIFWMDPASGEEILVALVSNGDAVGVAVGINLRTDTATVLDFIDDVVGQVEAGEL